VISSSLSARLWRRLGRRGGSGKSAVDPDVADGDVADGDAGDGDRGDGDPRNADPGDDESGGDVGVGVPIRMTSSAS